MIIAVVGRAVGGVEGPGAAAIAVGVVGPVDVGGEDFGLVYRVFGEAAAIRIAPTTLTPPTAQTCPVGSSTIFRGCADRPATARCAPRRPPNAGSPRRCRSSAAGPHSSRGSGHCTGRVRQQRQQHRGEAPITGDPVGRVGARGGVMAGCRRRRRWRNAVRRNRPSGPRNRAEAASPRRSCRSAAPKSGRRRGNGGRPVSGSP